MIRQQNNGFSEDLTNCNGAAGGTASVFSG
jgi:hypothetical protein